MMPTLGTVNPLADPKCLNETMKKHMYMIVDVYFVIIVFTKIWFFLSVFV